MATLLSDARREHQEMRKNKNARAWEPDRYKNAKSNGWDYRRFKNKYNDAVRKMERVESYSTKSLESFFKSII